jgi:hypothetical protein
MESKNHFQSAPPIYFFYSIQKVYQTEAPVFLSYQIFGTKHSLLFGLFDVKDMWARSTSKNSVFGLIFLPWQMYGTKYCLLFGIFVLPKDKIVLLYFFLSLQMYETKAQQVSDFGYKGLEVILHRYESFLEPLPTNFRIESL